MTYFDFLEYVAATVFVVLLCGFAAFILYTFITIVKE